MILLVLVLVLEIEIEIEIENENENEDEKDGLLIPEQFFESVARFGFARGILGWRLELAADHFEILAIIGHMLFGDGFGSPVAALIGHRAVVAHAVETHLEVGAAKARFRAAGRARQRIFAPALPAMSSSCHANSVRSLGSLANRES